MLGLGGSNIADADPSNYMSLGGLNPHADLDLAMEAGSSRDVFSSSAMATDHLFAPGRHGISRSASYDHATMMRSQLQAPGSSSQSSLYSSASFSGDFDFSTGSQAAVTHASVGAFDLQQMQVQLDHIDTCASRPVEDFTFACACAS